jgi:hypothetical protein
MRTVDTWKDKHADLDKITFEKDERFMNMKRDLAETAREKQTLVKRVEREDVSNRSEMARLEQQRHDLDDQLQQRNQNVSNLEEQSCLVCSFHLICLSSNLT